MVWVAAFLAFGLVVAIAAVVVAREAIRLTRKPFPALLHLEDAYVWIVERLPDDVAATLTPADLRRIINLAVELLTRAGVSANGSKPAEGAHEPAPLPHGPVAFVDTEVVEYVLLRAPETGDPFLVEQVEPVVGLFLEYLEQVGSVGDEVGEPPPDEVEEPPPGESPTA